MLEETRSSCISERVHMRKVRNSSGCIHVFDVSASLVHDSV